MRFATQSEIARGGEMKTITWKGHQDSIVAGQMEIDDAIFRYKAEQDILIKRIDLKCALIGVMADAYVCLQISDIAEYLTYALTEKYADIFMVIDHLFSSMADSPADPPSKIYENLNLVLEEDETLYFNLARRNDHASLSLNLGYDRAVIQYHDI